MYDVTPSEDQYEELAKWQHKEGVDFWRFYAPGITSKVMIAPNLQEDFESFLEKSKIPYKVAISNVEVILEEERRNITRNRQARSTVFPSMVPDFSVYWSSMEMEEYSTYLAATYPAFVQMETIIFSPENRRIYSLKISNGIFGQKPIIAMEGGMHAREW